MTAKVESQKQSIYAGSQYSQTHSIRSQFKQETVDCHRKYKNSPKEISNFFFNLCKQANQKGVKKGERSRSDGAPGSQKLTKSSKMLQKLTGGSEAAHNIPFQLLMCNFRRKKILEVLQDAQAGVITFEERDHLL